MGSGKGRSTVHPLEDTTMRLAASTCPLARLPALTEDSILPGRRQFAGRRAITVNRFWPLENRMQGSGNGCCFMHLPDKANGSLLGNNGD